MKPLSILNEPRAEIGYYRMRKGFKKLIKTMAKDLKISEAEALDRILVAYFIRLGKL
jgi:hypothetical protein